MNQYGGINGDVRDSKTFTDIYWSGAWKDDALLDKRSADILQSLDDIGAQMITVTKDNKFKDIYVFVMIE